MEKGQFKNLANGQVLDYESDQHILIVVQGENNKDYIRVSYKLDDIISPGYFGLIIGGFILVLSTCIGICILYGIRSLAKMHITDTKKLVMKQSQLMLW